MPKHCADCGAWLSVAKQANQATRKVRVASVREAKWRNKVSIGASKNCTVYFIENRRALLAYRNIASALTVDAVCYSNIRKLAHSVR